MRHRLRLLQLVALALLLSASLGARRIQGPIWGTITTSDGIELTDVVVRLRCATYLLHGAGPSDLETRIVATGERFSFWWAWGGHAPVGCAVRAFHPRYVSAYAQVGDDFANDLGALELVAWDDFLAAGPTDPPMHTAYPWPAMEIQTHLSDTYHDYVLEHPESARAALARYVPVLQDIFERAIQRLPTSWHDDSSWNRGVQETLVRIEQAVAYRRPASEIALAEAAAAGDTRRVRTLLALGTDPDALGADGAAPLHRAATEGHVETLVALLDGGADIDRQRRGAGDTPLLDALQHHRDETVLLLIDRGADVRLAAWRGSPLRVVASGNARPDVLRALLDAGAAADPGDRNCVLALHDAARAGRLELLRELLGAGVTPDATIGAPGWTALMSAAHAGRTEAVALLLDAGADPNAALEDGRTALAIAREKQRGDVVALLLERGARDP